MVWGYLFPSEDQDSQKRKVSFGIWIFECVIKFLVQLVIVFMLGTWEMQEVWKVSTVAGARRAKKGSIDASSGSQASKESEASSKSNVSITDQSTDSPRVSIVLFLYLVLSCKLINLFKATRFP